LDLLEIGLEGVDYIYLAQDMDRLQGQDDEHSGSIKGGEFLD
jgi:hypothetical protein